MARAGRDAGTAALSLFGLGSQQIAAFLITVLAASFLSTAQYGVYTLAVVFAEFVILLTYTGYFHFIVNTDEDETAVISTFFWVMVGIGAIGGGIIFVGSEAIARTFNAPDLIPVLRIFGLLQPFGAMIGWASAVLTRAGLLRRYYLAISGASILALVAGSAMLMSWKSVFALVGFRAVRIGAGLVFFGISVPMRPRFIFDVSLFKQATRYSMGLYGSSLLNFVTNYGADLLLAFFFSVSESGLYRFANRLAQATVEIVAQPFRTFALRSFGEAGRNKKALGPTLADFIGTGMLLLGGFAATLIVLSGPTVINFFRPEYAAAIFVVQALAVRAAARVGQILIQPVFATKKSTTDSLRFNFCVALAMISVTAIFASWGLGTLAVAQATVQIISLPAALWAMHRWGGVDIAAAQVQLLKSLGLLAGYSLLLWASWRTINMIGFSDTTALYVAAACAFPLAACTLLVGKKLGIFRMRVFAS